MLQARDEVSAEDDVLTEIDVLVRTIAAVPSRFILVSNEVGLGIVPDNELGRSYRDCLGRVNQMLAKNADEVYLLVAGTPVKIK
jgi:adenosylcobinamide kinase/adenosylcobinamide-phosphate guanylyltransferase